MTGAVAGLPSGFGEEELDSDAAAEEVLARAARTTDPQEREELLAQVVLYYLPLARSLAGRYAHRGEAMDDLIQVARLGLVHAVQRYRPGASGKGFAAFAVPTVLGELRRHFRDHTWAVRPPRRLQELRPVVVAAQERLTQELGRLPNVGEVAAAAGADLSETVEALTLRSAFRPESLEAPVPGSVPLAEQLQEPDRRLSELEDQLTVGPALRELSPRSRRVLRLRYLDELSQRRIAERIGVSQMQVSRILAQALRQVRTRMLSRR
ncbi:sigma-70 family RNA polymerase sigma factor [Ornithinicoccus halotolerans]|uniref:sigma-70 family RNA polymerase sigma factor n=1 Tax=Ornithinicoccus halotolerans TaxID=1748220 RepID=UPI001885FEE6|nr:sigma-70 family RNA polymerase sigma factor [Ornithinicoccus halotolerans]